MFPKCRCLLLIVALALSAGVAFAQVATGTPPFGSFAGGPDVINLANLNSHFDIPVIHKPGRGTNFTYDLSYDSSVWYRVGSSGSQSWQPVSNWGWQGRTEPLVGYASKYIFFTGECNNNVGILVPYTVYVFYSYRDSFGVQHPFDLEVAGGPGAYTCPGGVGFPTTATGTTNDGSGYTMFVTGAGAAVVYPASGGSRNVPVNSGTGTGTFTDRNGNTISVNGSGQFYDTLSSSTPVLTVSGSGTSTSPLTFTYTAASGASASYTMKYSTYTVQTAFGCGGSAEYGPTGNSLVSEIDLPDYNVTTNPNSRYTFTYEQTPGVPGNVTGRVASVTLPTGGTITYAYSGGNNGINCSDGWAATLTRTTPDGTWIYVQVNGTGAASTTTVTDPQNNQTVIQFQGLYETQRQVYQGSTSGTLLKTINTCYNGNTTNCTTTAVTLPITRRTETIQLGSLQCKHDRFWNSFGMLTEADDYDYASGAPGPLLRQTLITYANLGSNLNAFTQTVTVKDGSGTIKSRQDTNYDQYPSGLTCITGAPQHDDSGHGCSFTARANATSVSTYTNPAGPSGGITQNFTYDSLGNVRTAQDALNNTTTLAYSPDAWINTVCNPSTTSYAYPVSVTNALNQTTSFKYYACAGLLGSTTDANNQTTSVSYDSLLRPIEEDFPDGGQTSLTYNSPTSITTTTKMNSSQNIVSTVLLDGLGRTSQTQLNSDPQGVDYTDTAYDAVGRVASVSNPYRTTSDPTYGVTSYLYDALGRICVIIPPDGTAVTGGACPSTPPSNDIFTTYSTNTVTVTDQAGKKRQSTVDSLGRLTQVTEDPGGLGYVTTYTYDALSNLTGVTQNGGRQRTFTYDALSRLVCESNPEIQIATCPNPDNGSYTAGTIRYGYDNGGNLATRQAPAPNQTGSATVTTTYSWDPLHRLTQKSYSDGTTLTAFFAYEQASAWGTTLTNPVGRLTEEWSGTSCCATGGAEIFGYDPMGRIVVNEQYTATMGYRPMNYTYGLAGNLVTYTDGVGETYTQSFDSVGRVTQLNSSWVDSQHPATMLSGISYNPANGMTKITYGNGLTQTAAFNKNLQPCRINLNSTATALSTCSDAIPSGNWQDFNYGFNLGSSDNGNVMSWTATGQQAFNRSFAYDSLNRVATMQETSGNAEGCKPASSPSNPYTLSWTIDPWGNRTNQSPSAGTCSFSQTVNTQNQFVGSPYQYDAAGNMIHDASHTYFYDAENRLAQVDGTSGNCSTATACYLYDAAGRRARKAVGTAQTNYIYGLDSSVISEVDQNNTWMNVYLHMNGQFIAQYLIGLPRTQFILSDHLGSARVLTKYDGTLVDSLDFLPFGEQIAGGSGTTHEFTGDERDAETGLDHTWFRQYSSQLGRWMRPDPAGLAAVNPANPQSWNRYAYVLNNPLRAIDPLGLDCVFLNDAGDGIEEIAPELDASECGAEGGVYFAGSIDPGSFQADPNSDFVFAMGMAGNSQFSCGGLSCDPNSLGDFSNSVFGASSVNVTAAGSGSAFWNLMDAFWNHLPWAGGIFIPIPHTGGIVSVMIPLAYIPSTNTSCVGLGLAATTPTGKFVSGGPLVTGDLNNAKNILSGFGYNFGGQATPFVGVQAVSNSSGSVGGPTLATSTGLSGGYGYSVCR